MPMGSPRAAVRAASLLSVHFDRAGIRLLEQTQEVEHVLLPQPNGPTIAQTCPRWARWTADRPVSKPLSRGCRCSSYDPRWHRKLAGSRNSGLARRFPIDRTNLSP